MKPVTTAQRESGLEVRYKALLWVLMAGGLLIRLTFIATTRGNQFDLGSLQLVAHLLVSDPSHLYAAANVAGQPPRWPYPPGDFPLLLAIREFSGVTGLGFERLIRVPSALADLGIAWVVQDFLRHRAADAQLRLAAVALVTLGPSFIAISAVHGQIDAVAILPATIALSVWERDRPQRRAWAAGLLIGIGAAIKTVPGLMVLALLPTSRSRKEASILLGTTLVVPAVASAPIIALDGIHWLRGLVDYHGGIGLGGLSLLAQPDLPLNWLHLRGNRANALTLWFLAHGGVVAGVAMLACAAFLWRWRAPSPLGAVLVWLTIYVFGVSFFLQYMVWGLPFLLMAGYVVPVLALELLMVPPILVIYVGTSHAWIVSAFYTAPMLMVWVLLTAGLFLLGRRLNRLRRDPRQMQPAVQRAG